MDLSFRVGGTELKEKVQGLRVNLPWNGRATAATTFRNYATDGTRPYLSIPPDTLNLRHHSRGALDFNIGAGIPQTDKTAVFTQIGNLVQINITSLGLSTLQMPVFLGGGWQDQLLTGSWPAYDFTYFLDIDGQHMTDVLVSENKTMGSRMAHAVSAEIFQKYGIASFDLRFADHQVKQLRRSNGKPGDWLAKIRRKTQSGLRFRGTTAVVQPFRYRRAGDFAWPFKAGLNCSEFTWQEADQPPNNQFILTRVDPVKGRVGGQRCSGGPCPGRTVDFAISPPSNYVRTTIKVDPGGIKDWVFVDDQGVYHTGGVNGSYHGPPAVRALATYEPTFNETAGGGTVAGYTPFYEINAYGADSDDAVAAPYRNVFDDSSNHFGWPDTQDRYGIWEDYANLEDPLIASGKDLNDYGEAVLLESIRHVFAGVLKTPFINTTIEPGHWVFLRAPMSVMDGTYWFIEAVSYLLEGGTNWSMELALSKGLW